MTSKSRSYWDECPMFIVQSVSFVTRVRGGGVDKGGMCYMCHVLTKYNNYHMVSEGGGSASHVIHLHFLLQAGLEQQLRDGGRVPDSRHGAGGVRVAGGHRQPLHQ